METEDKLEENNKANNEDAVYRSIEAAKEDLENAFEDRDGEYRYLNKKDKKRQRRIFQKLAESLEEFIENEDICYKNN